MSDSISFAPSIPAAVRAAAARSEQLQTELIAQLNGEGSTVEPGPTEGQDSPTAIPESRPGSSLADQGGPTFPAEGRTDPPSQSDPWQARYDTLQGKYNSELRDLRADLNAERARNTALERALAMLEAHPPAPAPAPAPAAQPGPIPAADAEEYGPELITAAQRWALAALTPELNQLRQQVAELQGSTSRVSQHVAKSAIDAALDRMEPDWQTVNTDPGFMTWLSVPDPFSGATRKALADDAYARGDASRVAAFFRAYKSETGHTGYAAPSHAPQVQTPMGADQQPSLEDYAAPGTARGAPRLPGAPPKKIWARSEIQRFYSDVTRGRFAGRDAERQRMEADLTSAIAEGRIR